ncbi:hypothetical protein KSP40_PGU009803 [Platanthera guangdongensis]|uniref:Uncharacterized protein n=1 Tax=Platanthera guangdongensis TaxID=2320717 RepID=A0ABR2MWY8_9ASPA
MAKPVTLNLFVDKFCKKLIYAESDEHFVDILLSFFTLPLASTLRLTKQSFWSMNNLLESVESLGSVCFSSEACRSMLLCPSNSASHLLTFLPIVYDNISNLFRFYYTCSSSSSSNHHLSFYANTHCPCGGLMNKKLEFLADNAPSTNAYSSVFFNCTSKFIISDDLFVSQFSVEFSIEQLSKLNIDQWSYLRPVRVDVTAEKIVELLKRLLVSDTPLTDVFLGDLKGKDRLQLIQQPLPPKFDETKMTPAASARKISLKLHFKEDEETALFAEAGEDFVELLFGFLTYPMGAVIKKLGGRSGIRCMDNLYNSVEALKAANCFRNNELIGKLLNPKLPPFFNTKNQLIKLDEETYQIRNYFTCSIVSCQYSSTVGNKACTCQHYKDGKCRQLILTDPKRGSKDDPSTGGYMRISRYIVKEDLVIRPPSSHMVIAGILRKDGARQGIYALRGIRARNVEIGEHEALALLWASITFKNVFTDALLGVKRGKHRFRSLVEPAQGNTIKSHLILGF